NVKTKWWTVSCRLGDSELRIQMVPIRGEVCPHLTFDLVDGGQSADTRDEIRGLFIGDPGDDGGDPAERVDIHTQLGGPQADEDRNIKRRSGHFAADDHGLTGTAACINDRFERA